MLYIYFLLLCKILYSYYVISLTKVYRITFFDDVTAKVLKMFSVVIDPSRPCKHRQSLKPLDMKLILIVKQSSGEGSKHITLGDFSESKKKLNYVVILLLPVPHLVMFFFFFFA